MKILIVNSLYPPSVIGGAEKSVALLAEAMARRGNMVTVLTLTPRVNQREERNGVRVERWGIRNLYWPFHADRVESSVRRLVWHVRDGWNRRYDQDFQNLLTQLAPDVVHTNNLTGFSADLWRVARNHGVRTVHTLRDYSLLCSRAALFRDGRDCLNRCKSCVLLTARKKSLSGLVDAVVSNSAYVINRHRESGYFNRVPSSVIFNIADLTANMPPARAETAGLTFGFIGRVEPEKGIEVVLEATRQIATPDWRLKIAGDGRSDYVSALRARYMDDRIEWLGFANAPDFYAAIDTSLIASVWPEPLPRSLIESYAFGKSVICSDAGGIPEIAMLGPVSQTYPRYDSAALARCMDTALASATRWRAGGRPSAQSMAHFSEDNVVDAYFELYRGAVR